MSILLVGGRPISSTGLISALGGSTTLTDLQRAQAVWDTRHGVGLGPANSATFTTSAAFASTTAGVSDNGNTLNVSGNGVLIEFVDLRDRNLYISGNNVTIRNCLGSVTNSPAVGAWDFRGTNGLVDRCRFDLTGGSDNKPCIVFDQSGSGTTANLCAVRNSYFTGALNDVIKAPYGSRFECTDCAISGMNLVVGAHLDAIDMRTCAYGSLVERVVIVQYLYPGSVSSQASTGLVNAIRCKYGDNDFAAVGHTYRDVICVGTNEPDPLVPHGNEVFNLSHTTSTNMVMDNVYIDRRLKPSEFLNTNRGFHPSSGGSWKVFTFDASNGQTIDINVDPSQTANILGGVSPLAYAHTS